VAEHVRQVADPHCAAELVSTGETALEVADDRLARDEEFVDKRLPRPDREPAFLHKPANPLLRLGPNLEVVVDDAQLAVEREDVPLVGFENVEQPVDEPDELQPEALEREVPLPVPVRVWNELDGVI
jgi:hypothetical protein